MHLKILIGVLTLGLVSASPKAAPKPAAKASPQFYPGQPQYYPVGANSFGQNYAGQPFPGQQSSGFYNVRLAPSTYGLSPGNYFGAAGYSQVQPGNHYHQHQVAPVAYSSGLTANDQSGNYYSARLWPKTLVNPAGSPSPALAGAPQVYFPSSTPNPVAYQSTGHYTNSAQAGNYQVPVSTAAPAQSLYQPLIPVPVKVGSRNSFQSEATKYNTAPQTVAVTTPSPYLAQYQQQSTPRPYVQSYQQPATAGYQTSSNTHYVGQQPTTVPHVVNYQQQSFPYHGNYQHQSASASHQFKYQPSSPTSYSPFAAYQYQQQPIGSRYVGQYQQPTASPLLQNYQPISVPVAYPQSQLQSQFVTSKPTLISSITPAAAYPSSTIKPQTASAVVIQPASPPQTVSITERAFFPVPTTPSPLSQPKATIIKSEYNSGTFSPQFNSIVPSYPTANSIYKTGYQQSGLVTPQFNHAIQYSTASPTLQSGFYNAGAVSPQYNYVVPSYSTPSPFIKSVFSSGAASPQYSYTPSYSTVSPYPQVGNAYLPQAV